MKVEKKSPVGRKKTSPPAKPISESSGQQMVSKFCARQHPFAKKNCPAWGNSCKNCSHFAVCCQESKKKVLSMDWESEDEEHVAVIAIEEQLNSLALGGNPNQPHPYSSMEKRRGFS